MKIGDRVKIEYPGYALHKRSGEIVHIVDDDFLGRLYTIVVDGLPTVALPSHCLRPAMAKNL